MIITGFQSEYQHIEENFSQWTGKSLNKVIIFRPDDPKISDDLLNFLLKNVNSESKVYITNCCTKSDELFYKELSKICDLKYSSWSTYFAYETANSLLVYNKQFSPVNPSKTFCSLNHRPRRERCAFIDELAKHNLIDNNYVSWQGYDVSYDFKYFDNRKITYDNFENTEGLEVPFNEYPPPEIPFMDSLWSVVSEYTFGENPDLHYYITEKTFVPIAHKKPLIVLGGPRYYDGFKKLGFILYDDIVDYSFSYINNFDSRLIAFVEEVKRLSTLNIEETYKKLKVKIDVNYDNFKRIINKGIKCENGEKISSMDLRLMKTILAYKNREMPLYDYKDNILS